MEVAVDCSWVGDGVGSVAAPVGVAPGVAGVTAGMGTVFVGVNAGMGPGVGVSGAFVGPAVGAAGAGVGSDVASGAGELAGNAVVAAPGPRGAVSSGAYVTGLSADVAASAGAGTVATAAPGAGVCSPHASRAARITRLSHREQLQDPRSPFVALFLVALFVFFFGLGVGLTQSPLYGSLLWMAAGLISVGNLWWMVRDSNRA